MRIPLFVFFFLVFPFLARYLPLVCPLSPLEPHWNLIGISLEPHRNNTIESLHLHRSIHVRFIPLLLASPTPSSHSRTTFQAHKVFRLRLACVDACSLHAKLLDIYLPTPPYELGLLR